MERYLDSALCRKYPELYRYRHTKSICQWAYCGNGVFTLIDVMSSLIVEHNPNVFVTKLIRQHGGIVMECNEQDAYITGICMAGETISNYICDVCGAPGSEDKSSDFGVDIIRCKKHINKDYNVIDYDFLSLDCLRSKNAWSKYIYILKIILEWEVNNKRHRKFHVKVNDDNRIEIKLATKTEFTEGIVGVFENYCNRIDSYSGSVLPGKTLLSCLVAI